MSRSNAENLEILKQTRDAIMDALASNAGSDVISYSIGGRSVQRSSRLDALNQLKSINELISQQERLVYGPSFNLVQLGRRAR